MKLSYALLKLTNKCLSTAIKSRKYDYDFVVFGGTLGGLAAAKEASCLGATVAVVDNALDAFSMGCAPHRLIRQSAVLGEAIHDSKSYGWRMDQQVAHKWDILQKAIQYHVISAREATIEDLKDKNIKYISGTGYFQDPHLVSVSTKQGKSHLSGEYFLVALGEMTRRPNIPGALKYGVTIENLVNMNRPPGRTLVIGAGRRGLECAGVLNVLGYDTTVMVKSVPLKDCDQQMAGIVTAEMKSRGIKFLVGCSPKSVEKLATGKLKIEWIDSLKNFHSDQFDTVLFATDTKALTEHLQLEKAGVILEGIDLGKNQTNVPHIFTLYGSPEQLDYLGKLLARKLFRGVTDIIDYKNTPTTIFTPLEYSFVGLSEEEAIYRYQERNIEVYHTFYKPPEFSVSKKSISNCYLKVISLREGDQKVVGMHFVGPQAREIMQGFSAAMKCHLTVPKLVNTVGIHPTLAEEFTKIRITKRSGADPSPASCCS